ncbi:condensation domain-containing protein [Desulfotruncus alcoholivorax]|uniref:condensation domain-containing protein n=1 Tax=Desulfotruncus alcoholivorax TaxID=265477 RepID=UPI0012FEF650|nr:condensation domain-containing protein [Desulfotruncus alcoholivorax]
MDAEPILRCQFIENDKQPYWQPFQNPDAIQWFEFVQNDSKQVAIEQFLKSPFYCEEQMLSVQLIRVNDNDTLCVKISHACSDAGGLKQYLQLLAEIYSNLLKDSRYKPKPNTKRRLDQKSYFEALGIKEPLTLLDPNAQALPATWAFPYHGVESKEMHVSMRRFSGESFDRIRAFGKTHAVTINAIILTSFYRSMFQLLNSPAGDDREICVTMDLRRYFKTDPSQDICNLSVVMTPRVCRVEDEPFKETLRRVSESIEELRNTQVELTRAVGIEAQEAIEYSQLLTLFQAAMPQLIETGKFSPVITNMGIISPLQFGQIPAYDAYLVPPTIYAPGFLLGVSTYNRTLTLLVSYCEPSHRTEDIDALMDFMADELNSL